MERLVGQKKLKKQVGRLWMSRAKEIFLRVILGTRALGSSALA